LAFLCVLAVVLVLPIENVFVIPGVGSLSRLAGILLILSAVPAFLGRGYFQFRRQPVVVMLLALYVLWALASLMWSVDPASTMSYVFTFVQLLILVVVIWQLCVTDRDRLAVQQAYVIGSAIAVFEGVRNFVLGNEAVYQRFSVSNTDPNDYALILALAIPMAWDLFANQRGFVRVLNLLCIPLVLVGIILTGSRGGSLAAAVALLVVPLGFMALDRFGRRTILALLLAGLLAVPFFWGDIVTTVGSNIERISTLGEELSSGTLNDRAIIWDLGMEAFGERPLTGVGGGAFPAAIEKAAGVRELAHNTFISVAVEMGLVGLLLFGSVMVVLTVPLVRSYSVRTMPGVILLLTLLVGITPLTWEFRKPTWLVIALLLVLGGVQIARHANLRPFRPRLGAKLSVSGQLSDGLES
jgi:O-antigen ligase